eukprot:SAG22_NODE_17227_length_309_cov_0.733333_1_plen_21_part_01
MKAGPRLRQALAAAALATHPG